MHIEIGISDYNCYKKEMAKGMGDKLFFLDEIPFNEFDTVVDFGCADGMLLSLIHNKNPNIKLVGIDTNETLLSCAKENLPSNAVLIQSNSLDYIPTNNKTLLVLSSVLHEIYSYLKPKEREDFFKKVFNNGYKYIVIRDLTTDIEFNDKRRRFSPREISLVRKNNRYAKQLHEFEQIWGSIDIPRNMFHFLLKYSYQKNWAREVKENYIGYTVSDILRLIPLDYNIEYCKKYVLPFTAKKIKADFGIELKPSDVTHIKLILKKDHI